MLSAGTSQSTAVSSTVSLITKVNTQMSSVVSATLVGLTVPDIILDFTNVNITSFSQLRAAVNDLLFRAAGSAGLTQ